MSYMKGRAIRGKTVVLTVSEYRHCPLVVVKNTIVYFFYKLYVEGLCVFSVGQGCSATGITKMKGRQMRCQERKQ